MQAPVYCMRRLEALQHLLHRTICEQCMGSRSLGQTTACSIHCMPALLLVWYHEERQQTFISHTSSTSWQAQCYSLDSDDNVQNDLFCSYIMQLHRVVQEAGVGYLSVCSP